MSPGPDSARKGTGTLALLAAIGAASSARAGEDPFPLAKANATAALAVEPAGPTYARVVVNGREMPRFVRLEGNPAALSIFRADAEALGLQLPESGAEFVALAALPGVTHAFDPQHGRLAISAAYLDNPDNVIDMARRSTADNRRLSPVTALIVDYDVTASVDSARTRASGLLDARIVRDTLSLNSGWTLNSAGSRKGAVRLDSNLIADFPGGLRTLTIGDFVSAAPAGARAVRMGGIQLSSNFGLRPDLITYPLPDFSGSLAVPSQLDLVVNDRRLTSTELQAGQFSLHNIPAGSGRREIGVIIRDSLGRERYISASAYVSRTLLRPGLDEWAVNLGFLRRRFGVASADYGDLAGTFLFRRGIDSRLTLGLAGEAGLGTVTAGPEATVLIGSIAELSGQARVSRYQPGGDEAAEEGLALGFSLASRGRGYSLFVSGRHVSDGYRDLAGAGGDFGPSSFLAAGVDFDLTELGRFSFNVVRESDPRRTEDGFSREVRTVGRAGWRKDFGGISTHAEVSLQRSAGDTSYALFAGINIPLQGRAYASTSVSRQSDIGTQAGFALDRPAVVPGDTGLSLLGVTGRVGQIRGGVAHMEEWGWVGAEAEKVGDMAAGRISARGSLVVAGDQAFARRKSGGAMVLVETGSVEGVVVTSENQPSAESGRGQAVLLSGLVANVPRRIGIVGESLPPGAVTASAAEIVSVPQRAVARLDLGIRRYVARRIRLFMPDGSDPAPGTMARAEPSGTEYVIGLDGAMEINAALGDEALQIELRLGQRCDVDLRLIDSDSRTVPDLTCAARRSAPQIAYEDVL